MKLNRVVAAFCLLGCTMTAQAGSLSSIGIGAYGDSLSMQYSFWLPLAPELGYSVYYNGTQLNWVDQLEKAGYNFGPTISEYGEKYNSYDSAVAGDTTSDLTSQVSTIQAPVTSGAIGLVVNMIGADDFALGEYGTIYNSAANHSYNPLTDPSVIAFENTIISNITGSIQQTLAENPNVHMILATIPDVGATPAFESEYSNAAQRALVTEVIQAVNAQIIALAAKYDFPVVDLYGLGGVAATLTSFAGVTMKDMGGDSGQDIYLSDGFHPGTVAQGLIADTILEADHVAYGDSITPLSDQTIAKSAGLTPVGSTPTYYNIDPYVIYSPNIVPEPATLELAIVASGCALALGAWRRFGQRTERADAGEWGSA